MLTIRSTPTDGEQRAQMREWSTETRAKKFHIPAIPIGNRNYTSEKCQTYASQSGLTPPLPTLDLPESGNFSENREESSQLAGPLYTNGTTLGHNALDAPNAPDAEAPVHTSQPRCIVNNFTCKDTIAPGLVDCQLKMWNLFLVI